MSEEVRIAGFAVLAGLIAFVLRSAHRPSGAAAAMAAGLMLFLFAVSRLSAAADALRALSEKAGVGRETAALLLRLVGMAYLTEFAVQCCRDAGEEGLAAKTALCGKVLLMAQTLPLVVEIGDLALSLSP